MIEAEALPYIGLLLLGSAAAFGLALFAARRRRRPSVTQFMGLCLAVAVWVALNAGEVGSVGQAAKTAWSVVEYIPIALTPLCWLAFALAYSGQQQRVTRRMWLLIGLFPAITIGLIFTNDLHHLIWVRVWLSTQDSPFPYLEADHGPWYWVHTVTSYLWMGLGTLLLLNQLRESRQVYQRQAGAILIGAIMPWLVNVLFVANLSPVPHVDLTPAAFTISALTFAWALFSFRLLDLVPVARGAVIDSMSDAVLVLDDRNRIADLNQAAAQLIGVASRQALGRPAGQVLHAHAALVDRFRATAEILTPLSLATPGGERYFELRITSLAAHAGPAGRLIVLHDITEQRRAEAEIRALNAELEARVEARTAELAAAMQAKDDLLIREQAARADAEAAQHRLTFLAEAGQELSGSLDYPTTLRTVVNRVVPRLADWCTLDIVGEDGVFQRVAARHADPAKTELLYDLERRYPLDPQGDHGFPQVWRTRQPEFVPVVDARGLATFTQDAAYLAMLRVVDVRSYLSVPLIAREQPFGALTLGMGESGRQYTDADLDLARALAERVATAMDNARLYRTSQQAVQVRDEFLSIASHELKTPITSLQLAVQAVQRAARQGTLQPEYLARRLGIVEEQGRRLGKLVNDLLDISRIAAGRLELEVEETDLAALTRQVIEQFQEELAQAGCPVTFQAASAVTGCWDRARLEQVIANLLTNAMKYGRGQPIAVTVETAGPLARLRVRDQGIGIAPEHQERIFGRFERAVRPGQYSGMGLGLYIARQIVEAHQGRIEVASAPGHGATFTVELPLDPGAPPAGR